MPAKATCFLYENEEVIYTKVEALRNQLEVIRCKNDIVYFAEKFCYIIDDNGKNLIKLRDFQKEFLRGQVTYSRYILMCSRQVGKSTIASIAIAHFALFNPHKFIAIVSKDKSGSKEVLEKIRVLYSMLPKFLQRAVVSFGKEHVELAQQVRIKPFPAQSDEIRGFSIDYLYLDEFAFLHQNIADTFLTGVMPTITSRKHAKLLITTTPKGENHFKEMWDAAKYELDDEDVKAGVFKKAKIIWSDVPREDPEAWAASALAALKGDTQLFAQEYECEFISFFNSSLFKLVYDQNWWKSKELKKIKVKKLDDKIFDSKAHEDADLAYFYKNEKLLNDPEELFIGGLDTAGGLEQDYTVFNVLWLNKEKGRFEQFFKYSVNDVLPRDYPLMLDYMLAKMLKGRVCWLAIENNAGGGGEEVISRLLDINEEYSEILYSDKLSAKKEQYGVRTTPVSKKNRLAELKSLLKRNQLIIHDDNTASELKTFIRDGNKFCGSKGTHDDEVSSLWQMAEATQDDRFYDFFNKAPKFKPKAEKVKKLKYVSKNTINQEAMNRDQIVASGTIISNDEVVKDVEYYKKLLDAQTPGRRRRRIGSR